MQLRRREGWRNAGHMLSLMAAMVVSQTTWTVTTNATNTVPLVGDMAFKMEGGWECRVYDIEDVNAKVVQCSNGDQFIGFTADCEATDRHTVRLGTKTTLDAITVACAEVPKKRKARR